MSDEQGQAPQEEKQALITSAKNLPPPEMFSLKPRTFDEAFRFANLIAESTLIPPEFRKNPANVLIAVQLGMELGVSPMQALQNIAVVNGRPTIWGDLLPAIVYGSGMCEQFDEDGDDKLATCIVKRKGMKPITRSFSWAEAQRAGLAEKQTYKSYPKRMLQMRARAYAMRDAFADVLKGVAIKEDIEDLEMRDVTPIRTPQAITETTKDEPKSKLPTSPSPANESTDKTAKTDGSAVSSDVGRAKSETGSRRQRTAGQDNPSTAKAPEPPPQQAASEKTEPTAPIEKTQDDWIAEGKLWIENCPADELLADDNWLFQNIKQLKGTVNQMALLKPFNDRRQSLAKEAKG